MRVNAFDGKLVWKKDPNFKALLGIGVTIAEYSSFTKNYNIALENIFQENGIPRSRLIYKGSELQSIFYGLNIDIIPIFAEKLIEFISFIDVYYCYFIETHEENKEQEENKPIVGAELPIDLKSDHKIGVYYNEAPERLSYVLFLDLISNHFPAICCYAYLIDSADKVPTTYIIDHCPGLLHSQAVESVIKNQKTKFLFNGDKVNYAVSSADILCKYIEMMCQSKKVRFNKELIDRLGLNKEKFKTTYIGTKWLRQIKPSSRKHLEVSHKYPHPVIFFFTNQDSPFGKQSKEVIEKSTLYKKALEFAAKQAGSVKFFEPLDQEWITREDFLIVHDESSKKKITELKNLSCPATENDFNFFKHE